MNKRDAKFLATDILLIVLMIVPLLAAIVLKVLFTPATEGISITGALVFFTIPMPIQDWPITEAQVNSLAVLLSVSALCLYITHGIAERPNTKRQLVAEWIVEQTDKLVNQNMDPYFGNWGPFVASILGLSAFSSLLTLIGLYPPTSDINIVGGWAILVFGLITYFKFKCGPIHYLKSFGDPVPWLAWMNVISEFATPVSMAFRHYGNVLSGSVISILVAAALQGASNLLFGALPGFLGDIPFLRIGLPAVLSVYFDIFSGCMQAFIFAMLTMFYVSGGFPAEDYEKKLERKKSI